MTKDEGRPLVLVVEDIDWIRDGMVRQLREHGYDVVEATSAAGALALAESVRPALILTEEELPAYAHLADRLAAHPALCRLPVVIINPDAEDCARLGDTVLLSGYDRIAHLLAIKKQ
ncbi:MAG TPA: response regulator [Pyrinomonadaceae bacterium]|nr:response regulator [Pyrinomonadaceae bacterium]